MNKHGKVMKIALVWPAGCDGIRYIFPRIGLCSIASIIRKNFPSAVIKVFDGELDGLSSFECARRVACFSPDIIGISAMYPHAPYVHEFSAAVKGQFFREKREFIPCLVAGGAYPTASPEKVMADKHIDFCVRGDGEKGILVLLEDAIVRKINDVNESEMEKSGICYRSEGELHISEPCYLAESELNGLPFPAWDILELNRYFEPQPDPAPQPGRRPLPISTSRGCPMKCIYCNRSLGGRFRPRSPESVLSEIEWLKSHFGADEIHIVDESFNADPKRALEIGQGIINRGLQTYLRFSPGLLYGPMSRKLLDILIQAGMYAMTVGVESGSEKTLKRIGRPTLRLNHLKAVIGYAAKRGVLTRGLFMLGFPDETISDMMKTIKVARQVPFYSVFFSTVVPYPGTELARIVKLREHGIETVAQRADAGDYHQRTKAFNLSPMPNPLFLLMKIFAHAAFYLKWSRIVQVIRWMPTMLMHSFRVKRARSHNKEIRRKDKFNG